MFAGVAASSMPTVSQFFTRQSLSLTSLKSTLTHLLSSSSARMKLPENSPSFTDWGGSNTHTSEDREGCRMKHLGPDGCARKAAKAPRVGESLIYLTHDISITQEQLDDASFRPVVTDHHR